MATTTLDSIRRGDKPASPVGELSHFLDKMKPQMALALPKHLTADRMARLALTAFSQTPKLRRCTPQSIAGSLMTAAQLGLEPNVGGQGYLVPYKETCTFVPGWRGLVDLVNRSGRATVWTGAVRVGDEFEYQLGDAPFVKHKPGEADDDVPFTHVYAVGRVRDAQMPVLEVWTRAKVDKHLRRYNKVGDEHYARASENNFEMYGRKVALLQVLKYMPSSIELEKAVAVAQAVDQNRGFVIEGDMVTVEPEPPAAPPAARSRARPAPPAVAAAAKAAAAHDKPSVSYAQLVDELKRAEGDDDAMGLVLDRARALPDAQRADFYKLAGVPQYEQQED